jgi:hypothetical protein
MVIGPVVPATVPIHKYVPFQRIGHPRLELLSTHGVNQSMQAFAIRLAAAAASSQPGATLETMLSDLIDPALATDRQHVQDWLAKQPQANPPVLPFGSAAASMLIKRWDMIRRLRFGEDEPHEAEVTQPTRELHDHLQR